MPIKIEVPSAESSVKEHDQTRVARHITALLGPLLREETYQGRKHLVAPVTALVEGVIQAMNAPEPEFVAAQTFSDPKTVLGFNGRPLFYGHPMKDGNPTPGNTPELLEKSAFGTVFHTTAKKKKLTLEAWVDIEKANEVDPRIVERLQALSKTKSKDNQIEVSVGVFVDMDESATGKYNGEEYKGEWKNIVPDHLAILQDGSTGACSCEMGCGVRTARAPVTGGEDMETGTLADKEIVADNPTVEDKNKVEDPAIKNNKAKNRTSGFFDMLKSSIRNTFRGSVSGTESDQDVRTELMEALQEMEPDCWSIVAVYSDRVIYSAYGGGGMSLYQRSYTGDEATGYVVDANRVEVEPVTTFEVIDLAGVYSTNEARAAATAKDQIQQMHDHSVAMGASCYSDPSAKAAESKCSHCGGAAEPTAATTNTEVKGESDMTKIERIAALLANKFNLVKDQKALEAASDDTLTVLEGHCVSQKAAEDKAVKDAADAKIAEDAKVAAAAKKVTDDAEAARLATAAAAKVTTDEPLTEAEFLAAAPKRLKDMISRQEAQETARHSELVTAMKAAQTEYTEDELKAMELSQLERMSRIAKVPAPVVDFSGRGTPRATENSNAVPAPPNFNERVRAARQAKAS